MPASSRIVEPAQELKVFWFFSLEKNVLPALRLPVAGNIAPFYWYASWSRPCPFYAGTFVMAAATRRG